MSFMDADGRSGRFLTRGPKWAITSESAPRSSKKWLSAGTCSTCMTSASTPARPASTLSAVTRGPAGAERGSARSAVMTSPPSRVPLRTGGELAGAKHVPAVEVMEPIGVIDRVQVPLAEIRGDGHRGELPRVVAVQPARGAAHDRAGGAAEQEPAPGQPVAGPDGIRFLDEDHLVHVGLVEQRRTDAGP